MNVSSENRDNPNRGQPERLADCVERAVSLAGRELGVQAPMLGGIEGADGEAAVSLPLPVSPALPVSPVPQPVPGSVRIGVARGDLSATFGVSGTPITGGFLQDLGEYNPELMGRAAIPAYEKMRRGDAQVHATLAACKLPVQSAKWDFVPGVNPSAPGYGRAKEIAGFVRGNIFGGLEFRTSTGGWATQSWTEVLRNALLMLDFGCAVHEDVWTVDGAYVRLRRLAARLPLTFYRWHTEADGETLVALEQYGYRGNRFLSAILPADKIARFTYNQEGANFWGMALLRPMYPHWFVKNTLYRVDAVACERNSLGVPVWRLPEGFAKEDRNAAYNFVTQLAAHEATGAVEPPGDATSGFRIVGYQGQVRDLRPSIEHHNVMISRAALALFMDLGTSETGSRALGQSQGDFFMLSLQNLADQIAWGITNTSIRRLVAFNFGEDAVCPRLVAANVQSRGLAALVDALTRFAQTGLVVSEDNLRRFIREELALPEESSKGVVAIRSETVEEGRQEVGGGRAEVVSSGPGPNETGTRQEHAR